MNKFSCKFATSHSFCYQYQASVLRPIMLTHMLALTMGKNKTFAPLNKYVLRVELQHCRALAFSTRSDINLQQADINNSAHNWSTTWSNHVLRFKMWKNRQKERHRLWPGHTNYTLWSCCTNHTYYVQQFFDTSRKYAVLLSEMWRKGGSVHLSSLAQGAHPLCHHIAFTAHRLSRLLLKI